MKGVLSTNPTYRQLELGLDEKDKKKGMGRSFVMTFLFIYHITF